jgi:hypothetical protein
MSRRESIQLSATAIAALSIAAIRATRQLRRKLLSPYLIIWSRHPYATSRICLCGLTGPRWNTRLSRPVLSLVGRSGKTQGTPDIEHDYRKMKVRLDGRGTTTLSGTLTFADWKSFRDIHK